MADDTVDLLLKIKSESSQARSDINSLKTSVIGNLNSIVSAIPGANVFTPFTTGAANAARVVTGTLGLISAAASGGATATAALSSAQAAAATTATAAATATTASAAATAGLGTAQTATAAATATATVATAALGAAEEATTAATVELAVADVTATAATAALGAAATATDAALAPLLVVIGAVVIAVAALAAGTLAAAGGIFALAKMTSEFGGHIYELSQKTGVSVGMLSTLNVAAETSGTTIEKVNTSLTRYFKAVSDANHGSDQMIARFDQVGFTSAEIAKAHTSNDAAVQLLIKHVGALSNESDRLNALSKLGIKNGQDLNGVIKEMDGDFEAFRKHAEQLGLVITPEQAKQADKFDDTLVLLGLQLKGIAYTVGREVIPTIQDALDDLSRALTGSAGGWQEWGRMIRDVVDSARAQVAGLAAMARSATPQAGDSFLTRLRKASPLGTLDAIDAGNNAHDNTLAQARGRNYLGSLTGQNNVLDEFAGRKGGGSEIGDTSGKAKADKAAQERIRQLEQEQKETESAYRAATESIRRELGLQITSIATATQGIINAEKDRYTKRAAVLDQEIALAKKQSDRDKFEREKGEAATERDKNIQAAEDNRNAVELQAKREHADALVRAIELSASRQTEALQAAADIRGRGYEGAEDKIAELEVTVYNAKLERARAEEADFYAQQKDLNDVNLEEAQRYSDAIKAIQADQEAAQEEHDRRRHAARQKDLESERRYRADMLATERQITADRIALDRQLILAQERRVGVTAESVAALADLDIQEAESRRDSLLDQLRQDEEARKKLAGSEEEKAIIEQQYQAQRLDAWRKFRADRDEIMEGANKESAGLGAGGGFDIGLSSGQIVQSLKGITSMTDAMKTLGSVGGAAVKQLAAGVGQLVNNFVLMGAQGPHAMRKMVASILAGVSAQAATMAIMELAYGIAASSGPWGVALYGNPGAHFAAAALFGSIAVVSGVAGRVVAGDLFQDQAATGSGAASGTAGSTGTTGTGSTTNPTITQNRNQPTAMDVHVHVHTEESTVVHKVLANIRNNGELRNEFQTLAGA